MKLIVKGGEDNRRKINLKLLHVPVGHGKNETQFINIVKKQLRLTNFKVYAKNNGKNSIQIDDLQNYMKKDKVNKINKTLSLSNKEYDIIYYPIMDCDDTTEERILEYKSGDMFKTKDSYQKVVPIYNDKNLDEVLYKVGIIDKIPNKNEKSFLYKKQISNLFDKQKPIDVVNEMINKIRNYHKEHNVKITNIDILLEIMLEEHKKISNK